MALTRVAWHFGNRHLPTEILPKALRIRRDPVIEAMAEGLGARVIALEAPFNPEGGAYAKAEGGAPDAHPTAMITRITTMITATIMTTPTTIITTTTIAITTTPAAIIQITSTTMGIANDPEADCLSSP